MALLPSTHDNGLQKRYGIAKFMRKNADGTYQAMTNLSPSAELGFTMSAEESGYTSQEGPGGELLDSATDKINRTFELTLNRMSMLTLSMFVVGGLSSISQASGSVTAEVSPYVFPDTSIQLGGTLNNGAGVFGVTSPTISSYEGLNAADWVTLTVYALGAVAAPTTPNGHWYMATTAGTAAASEPTWTTDGSTVTDGTVVWQDMGLIEYVADTDYELDSTYGVINIPTTGAIATAALLVPASLRALGRSFTLNCAYTRAAKTFEQVATGASTKLEGEFWFYTDNNQGINEVWRCQKASIVPNGSLPFKTGTDYGSMAFTVTALKPAVGEAILINGVPA